MSKINPISNDIKIYAKGLKNKKLIKQLTTPPYAPVLKTTLVGAAVAGVSTFLQDYNKTSVEDNYFQFKINPETNEPYKADVFQNAAAMNLYLGNDVLVTAPTGTGKTAIAQYVITKNLNEGKRTFYTTPLKALSNEKFREFSKIYGEENVGLLTGDTKVNPDAPVVIMTTEVYRNMVADDKFNLTKDGERSIPSNLQTVVFDELQYLGDIDRGGIWEQSIMFTPKNVQMLSLSATIGNNEDINNWIASTKKRSTAISITPDKNYKPVKKDVKETVLINVPPENRHVPLNFVIENTPAEMKLGGGNKKQKIEARKQLAQKMTSVYAKPDFLAFKNITAKLNKEGKLPAIYFVFSKKECRRLLNDLSTNGEILTNKEEQNEIKRILKEYRDNDIYLGEGLDINALIKGYAIHNAGLLPNQKMLVEELFQKKLVKVVLATETLSAGINMPAKTVVISSPRKPASTSDGGEDHKRFLTANEFHQMAGRAGRRGLDEVGYCYCLSCNFEQTKYYEQLINSPSNELKSNLDLDYSFIANYMSEFFDNEVLKDILSKSLYVYDKNQRINEKKLDEIINKFNAKKNLLEQESFIKNGKLTLKGELLKILNGYEQVPVINLITKKTFADLNPIQIAAVISALANIEYNTSEDFVPNMLSELPRYDMELMTATNDLMREISHYNYLTESISPDKQLELDYDIVNHVYAWAALNNNNGNSRENWKDLYKGDLKRSIRDEGSLFKEITTTCDLIKQLLDVAKCGAELSPEDSSYYNDLYSKLLEALDLLQREPIPANIK